MRSVIVGTAGHIDHGKSALVHALTGTDPDRLKEEKERGITIDLGFAHLSVGEVALSFVDVPGHERFVRQMVAGAHGIDAVLLVIAADESVMPQTREHFHICRLLGIPTGVVALTKCDVADAELQTLAELEARELVKGSFLEGAPIVRVSARTRAGLDRLVQTLVGLTSRLPERSAEGLLRLPVDRVFTLRGFGTIVTGTLVSGALAVGQEVALLPSERRARVRGLQIHGEAVDRVSAGHRAAVNLAAVEVEDVQRGDVVAHPATLRATRVVDVALTLLPDARRLEPRTRVRVHAGSAEVLGRVVPVDAEAVAPGAEQPVRLRLERPLVLGHSDRMVLRSYSPAVTIGGARVLDPLPPRRRRGDPRLREHLERLSRASTAEALALFVAEADRRGCDVAALAARLALTRAQVAVLLAGEPSLVVVGRDPGVVLSRAVVETLSRETVAALERYHRGNPLRETMPLEELRARVFAHAAEGLAEQVVGELSRAEQLRLAADGVALMGHRPAFSTEEQTARQRLLDALRDAGLAGLEPAEVTRTVGGAALLGERVARALVGAGEAHRAPGGALIARDHVTALAAAVRERWPAGALLDVGTFKEMTGLTRKRAIPLLELLDGLRVTRRAGNERLVLASQR